MSKQDLVLIYSIQHGQYWGPNRNGHVLFREIAGKYTREEATALCLEINKHVRPGDKLDVVIEEIELNPEEKVSDYISKAELREWCDEIIQKEVFRKTIRFPQDKLIADTKESMIYRIIRRFCEDQK